jgi:L-threonylcarbamoyladenylate synthase
MEEAKKLLIKPNTVGILPTDTVYGLVARACDAEAVSRLYRLKDRSGGKPGTIIAADLSQLEDLGLKHRYLKAVEQYWPGAVSVIIPVSDPRLAYLHQGKMGLAVRVPDNKGLLELLKETGPLLTSSANHPGEPTASTAEEAKSYFGSDVDFAVDGGDLSGHKPSTVIRILDDAVEVLREGAVKIDKRMLQ